MELLAAMTSLSQLEAYSDELAAAIKVLGEHCQDTSISTTSHLAVPSDAPCEVHLARRNVLAIASRLHAILAEPADLIQHLASQVLASLRFS